MSESLFLTFEIIGTVAFAISGAMLGLNKNMDVLGISILGLTTAVGGGIIRDILLGILPPNTFRDSIYALIAIITSIVVFLPQTNSIFHKNKKTYDSIMLWMDSIGLGIFTVVGIKVAFSSSYTTTTFLAIFVGVITGVGGGIMRDIMAGDQPYIFVKHFYASASIIGAFLTVSLWTRLGPATSMGIGTTVIVILRILAAKLRWSLPKPNIPKEY